MKVLKLIDRKNGVLVLLSILVAQSLPVVAQWKREGSAPATNGQVEGIDDKEVAGAVQRLAPDPVDANILYVGAVNGGIWMTTDALSDHPKWFYISFDMPGQSIGALELDPTDATHKTLVAGIGRFSSYELFGAGSYGVFKTRTGNAPWENLDPTGIFQQRDMVGLAARGRTIVTANIADGIWRTTNNGQEWVHISGTPGTGLPMGGSLALIGDPVNLGILYAHAANRLYKSLDTGATWKKISNVKMEGRMASLTNLKLAVGRFNNVFVAIVQQGVLQTLYNSPDGGLSWGLLDIPITKEKSRAYGIHPGRQGELHMSLAADPVSKDIVYIGGDRQPYFNEPDTPRIWPNSIGANDYSGRLFRVDASVAPGQQISSLTHKGTAHNSSPHADSRFLCFDAVGNLLESDDGGVYRRTDPRNSTGDWYSANGNLDVTEIHSVAWDEKSKIILSGAQDNGNPQQQAPANIKWNELSKGDGGDVSIDNLSRPNQSIRYSSYEELQGFQRSVWGPNNVFKSATYPLLLNVANGKSIAGFDFVAPIRINNRKGERLIIASTTGLFESLDQGNTVRLVGLFKVNGDSRHALAYGSADNEDIIYAGSADSLMIRASASAAFMRSVNYPGGTVQGVILDPLEAASCFVIDPADVYHTADTGNSWVKLTGNLVDMNPGALYTVSFIPAADDRPGWVVVGSDNGVFFASAPNFNVWKRLGNDLPPAAVFDLEYDLKDKILIAGTMGLGAWSYRF